MYQFGDKIRTVREKKQMTMKAVAAEIGVTESLISQIETNKVSPSIETLLGDKDAATIWRGPLKGGVIRQFIADIEWSELDYMIIDSPPGTGDEPLTVAQTISDAKALIVTTPQEVSLADVRKSINFCKTVKMDIFGLVENMSGFECPHCAKTIDLYGSGGGETTAQAMGVKFLGKIPFDPKVVSCGDAGISLQEQYKDSPITKAFAGVAEKISAQAIDIR